MIIIILLTSLVFLTELPDEDLKEVMFIIEYKRKRNEEREK